MATDGWIVASLDESRYIAAAAGPNADQLLGRHIGDEGSASFVIGSGQPLAISPRGDDDALGRSMAELTGRHPTSILSVPCSMGGDVLGALELVDKAAGDRFSFDDLELVTLLAGIAGAALAEPDRRSNQRFSADGLADALKSLAISEPARFDSVAAVLAMLLEHA